MLTKYEAIIATATVSASGRKELLGESRQQQHRQEHGHGRQGRRQHRQRHGVGAIEGRVRTRLPHPLMAVNRLEHDDRVVDQPAHGEGQTAQGERVQCLAGRVEDD